MPLFAVSVYFLNKVSWRHKILNLKSTTALGKCFERLPKKQAAVAETETHAAMERLAADSGLTSATSLAFCKASFWLAASSSSCSSCGERRRNGTQIGNQKQLLGEGWSRRAWRDVSTLVSSCALARLSTAMAKNTLSRVSGETVKGLAAHTWHNLFVNVAARHIHSSHRLKTGSGGLPVGQIAVGRRYQG